MEGNAALLFYYSRLLGQAVKTSPFQGDNMGSIPVGVICKFRIYKNLKEMLNSY